MTPSVAGALRYLRLTSLRNALRARLLRLKQPKYLAGGVIGIAYIYFFFIRVASSPRGRVTASGPELLTLIELGGAASVLIFAVLCWIVPSAPKGLAFTEAEIALLFPAPIPRRTLIHYRLLSSQFALLFSALIFGIVSARWSFAGNMPMRTLAWWLVLATLNLHATGASFAIARLLDKGVTAWPRRILVSAVVSLVVAALFLMASPPAETADLGLVAQLVLISQEGPLHWLLFVPKLVIAPFFARDLGAYAVALVPALAVVLAHYSWVVYSETAFEEASLMTAQKRAARAAAMRAGKSLSAGAAAKKRREPFALRGRGRAEIAFLWKNLLAGSGFFTPRSLVIAAGLIFVGCRWLTSKPELTPLVAAASSLSIAVLMITALFGPQIARNDLRGDLPNADLLKTYPLQGWQVALGELLAPALSLTAVLWLALLAVAMTIPDSRFSGLAVHSRIGVALGLALLAPAWCTIQLIVLNALSLLFPAWLQVISNRGEHGFDVLGQRILFVAAQMFVVIFAFIPAAIVAAIAFLGVRAFAGTTLAIGIAVIAVLTTVAVEIGIGVRLLGMIFERFDLSRESRA
jgi:ABC-2 type transport system permease protein